MVVNTAIDILSMCMCRPAVLYPAVLLALLAAIEAELAYRVSQTHITHIERTTVYVVVVLHSNNIVKEAAAPAAGDIIIFYYCPFLHTLGSV